MIDREILQQCTDYISEHGLGFFVAYEMNKTNRGKDLFSTMRVRGISVESAVIELKLRDEWFCKCRLHIQEQWRVLSDKNGQTALTVSLIREHGYTNLYEVSKYFKLALPDINNNIGKKPVYPKKYVTPKKYTKESFDKIVRQIVKQFRCIPSTDVLGASGYHVISNHLKEFYLNLYELRKAFGVDDVKLQANNGWYLRSIAECCFVNYLLAHGIEPTQGGPYPQEFFDTYRRKGVYDPGFYDHEGNEIKCEIFGGGRMHQEDYNKIRKMKEDFHSGNPKFLTIEFQDCYKDEKLRSILERFIGRPKRIINDARFPDLPATMYRIYRELPTGHSFTVNNFKEDLSNDRKQTCDGYIEKEGWYSVKAEGNLIWCL